MFVLCPFTHCVFLSLSLSVACLFVCASQTTKVGSGTMNLGGSLTRQSENDSSVSDAQPHIANIGRMVEVRVFACVHV